MANSEMNSDVLSCCSDFKDSFIHEMFNATTQKLNSPSDKVITRSSLPVTKNRLSNVRLINAKHLCKKGPKLKFSKRILSKNQI